jgi:hypothetical protein
MDAAPSQLWTAGWSRRRRAAVAIFGLFMLYVQSLYFTGFYLPEEEYWFPFWTGMTVGDRLLSLALASWSNAGLIIAPFLRRPGRVLRTLLVASLACGAIVSFAWIGQSLQGWIEGAIQYPEFLMQTLRGQGPTAAIYYSVYGLHIYFCVRFGHDLLSARREV